MKIPKAAKGVMTRREMLKWVAGSSAVALAAPMVCRGRYRILANSPQEYSARAIDLVKRATVIDMLGLLTLDFPKQAKWFANPESFTPADLQPFKDSGINILHPATGIGGTDAHMETLKFLANWNGCSPCARRG